jgi:hypothetical protein
VLDNPRKTAQLIFALKAATPFDVDLTPEAAKSLQDENRSGGERRRVVSGVYYAGDEGGILCRLVSPGEDKAIYISLTHLRVPLTMPLAPFIIDYQRHRVKKLRKQSRLQ